MFNDVIGLRIVGEFHDTIRHKDGRIEDLGWNKNLIVNNASVLIACLMKGEVGYTGLKYWAVGEGSDTWDIPALSEIAQIEVTAGASNAGSVTITLNGTAFPVTVSNGDTTEQVATKIRNAVYTGWSTSGEGATVIFTSAVKEDKTNTQFSGGTTGVTATVTTTQNGTAGSVRPDPVLTDFKLVSEIFRKEILAENIKFLDANGNESVTPTNIIEVGVIFEAGEAIGEWREFAIFGGNATSVEDSGLNINYKTHGLIDKTNEMSIERKIKFTFLRA